MTLPSAASIESALRRIESHVERTRLFRSEALSTIAGVDVLLKLENEQRTGSFKLRGATNVIALLTAAERARGVVAASAGNHGLGVACAARAFGIDATIFIPRTAPRVKRKGILALGARVIDDQPHYDAALSAAMGFSAEHGQRFINPCFGEDLLAGQGTVALEIHQEIPDLHTLIVSVGGGGLVGGCAGYLRERAPRVRIVGAQTEHTDAMARSLAAGRVTAIEDRPTLADGLAGQVDAGALAIGQLAIDDMVVVTERDVATAMLWLLDAYGLRVEGSGASGVAAVLTGAIRPTGKTAIVVSGGNVDDDRLERIRASEQ